MPLTTSCEALYFPPEPMDNILTLRWNNSEQFNLGAYSMILYKLKCSAPRLFHVVPRYGAIPLIDGSGNESDEARRGVNVIIGLHGYVLKAREAALQSSLPDNNDNSANGNSPIPRPVAPSSINLISASGIPIRLRPQEKFAIEYVLLTGEHLAYQEMTKALTNSPASVTEEAERLWALVVAGAFSRTHLLQQSSIVLTAYTEHVILHSSHNLLPATTEISSTSNNNKNENGNGESNKYITVPSHAQLIDVPPSRWQQTSISPRSATNKETEESYRNGNKYVNSMSRASVQTVYSPNATGERQSIISNGSYNSVNTNTNKDSTLSAVFAASPTRRTNEELKALKEEIRSMRSEQTPSPGSGTPYYNNNNSNNNNNSYSNLSNGVRHNDPRNSNKNNTAQLTSSTSLSSHKPLSESQSERQKFDPNYAITSSGKDRRGIPLPRTSASNTATSNSNSNNNLERASSSLSAKNDIKAARKKEVDKKAAMLLMHIPSTARPPRQGNGVKLYMLLIIMFMAYFFILYLRRPAKEHINTLASPSVMTSYHTFATNYSNDNSGGLVQNHNMLNATEIHIPR